MRPRVVITGMGVVSALGVGQAAQVKSLMQGASGIGEVRYLPTQHREFPVGEVSLSHDEMLEMLQIHDDQRYSRTSLLGMIALREALAQARLLDREDLAFISGTTVGGMDVTEQHFPEPLPSGMRDVHDCGANTNGIADYFGCFDYTSTVSTACSSAMNALITAKWLIESGERDIVVAGGSEALSLFHLNGFKSLMILDQERCRPFDKMRAGLNLGEGAAYLVLEREETALARQADILGVLSGVGNACDAYHQTASSENGEGGYRAMMKALEDAGIDRSRIDYVNAHGTATPNNDMTESAALRRVFGEKLPSVSSTKSYTGHTTSASGSIEAVFCLLALQNGFLPFQWEFQNPDASCIIPVSGFQCPRAELHHVMCNSFGFGGNDSSIILSRYE
ncbi:MAG: beta-ketoacyl-[acyl-carrier-protein] synthase family protein [Bacteroidales bacterium]|nr:beta-ketoacyl-[acyl-carrier-protein] synthase family protein [Bacteroidales bacterium]